MKAARFVTTLCCLLGLGLPAAAQESTYSADSLMAAFDQGSRISLKGTQIVFRDIVVESRNSRVTFKSSQSSRVICELVSLPQHDRMPTVGAPLKVIGKVRGRGLLGNVTLDDCIVASVDEPTASPEPIPQELAAVPPQTVSEETPPPPVSVADVTQDSAKPVATTPKVRPAKPVAAAVKQEPLFPTGPDHEDKTKPGSESQGNVRYSFYALLVLIGAVGSSVLRKALSFALHFSRQSTNENTPEVRKAALQALLLKEARKK